jgi:hypothetical protein
MLDGVPQLGQVVAPVRDRHQTPTRPQHARQVADRPVAIRHVVEHPSGNRSFERAVRKR